MTSRVILSIVCLAAFSSCKKERECYCTLSNGTRQDLAVNDTWNKGQKKCYDWAKNIKDADPNAACYFK